MSRRPFNEQGADQEDAHEVDEMVGSLVAVAMIFGLAAYAVAADTAKTITGKSDKASVRYDFAPDAITANLTNTTAEEMHRMYTISARPMNSILEASG